MSNVPCCVTVEMIRAAIEEASSTHKVALEFRGAIEPGVPPKEIAGKKVQVPPHHINLHLTEEPKGFSLPGASHAIIAFSELVSVKVGDEQPPMTTGNRGRIDCNGWTFEAYFNSPAI